MKERTEIESIISASEQSPDKVEISVQNTQELRDVCPYMKLGWDSLTKPITLCASLGNGCLTVCKRETISDIKYCLLGNSIN